MDGSLSQVEMRTDPVFGFQVPKSVEGVDSSILEPRETWADKSAYDEQARNLVRMFAENFEKFESQVDSDVISAAPVLVAAE